MPLAEKYSHTTEEIYALPEGKRAELIDGQIMIWHLRAEFIRNWCSS